MKRIGIDLGVLSGANARQFADEALRRIPDCPGALLRLSRDEYDSFVKCGERFVTPRADLPPNERGDVRVSCRNEVMWRVSSHTGGRVVYGLCASCHGMEERQRVERRQLAKGRREAAE